MTNEQAKKMLKAQLECLKRETTGTDFDCNNRNCDDCSLCYEQGNIGEQKETLDMAIQALEQEPCEDAIGRSETIEYLNTNMGWYNEDGEMVDNDEKLKAITDLINGVPSVTPVPKKCHNENHDYAECDQFVCSNCGIELQDWHRVERDEDDGDVTYHEYEFKYYPNCGAKIDKRTLKYADQDTIMSAT